MATEILGRFRRLMSGVHSPAELDRPIPSPAVGRQTATISQPTDIPLVSISPHLLMELRAASVEFDEQLTEKLTPSGHRHNVILLTDGSAAITKDYRNHPVLRQVIGDSRRLGRPIHRLIVCSIVDLDRFIRGMDTPDSADGAQDMEREILSMLSQAVHQGATDVQIHGDGRHSRVRFVINDQFRVYAEWPREKADRFMAATYNLCSINDGPWSDTKSQGARLTSTDRITLPGGLETVRIEVAPAASGGRCMVMRLLLGRKDHERKTLEGLGYDQEHILAINRILEQPFGACYIAGPTGSGKSTTLAVCLEDLYERRSGRNNIVTIEDPPEYKIAGSVQYPVANAMDREQRTQEFAKTFRSVLRSKPHVIMVGEIRDGVAANLLLEAAQSGHQAFTSIHAKDSFTIIPRLAQMGAPAYLVQDATLSVGLIFQRLIRTLCPKCSISLEHAHDLEITQSEARFIRLLGARHGRHLRFRNPSGCTHCSKGASELELGYRGQTVAAEVVNPTDEMLHHLMQGSRREAMREWMKQDTALTAFEHGIRKMAAGLVDPRDVFEKLFDPVQFEMLCEDPTRLDFVVRGKRDENGKRILVQPKVPVADVFRGTMRAAE